MPTPFVFKLPPIVEEPELKAQLSPANCKAIANLMALLYEGPPSDLEIFRKKNKALLKNFNKPEIVTALIKATLEARNKLINEVKKKHLLNEHTQFLLNETKHIKYMCALITVLDKTLYSKEHNVERRLLIGAFIGDINHILDMISDGFYSDYFKQQDERLEDAFVATAPLGLPILMKMQEYESVLTSKEDEAFYDSMLKYTPYWQLYGAKYLFAFGSKERALEKLKPYTTKFKDIIGEIEADKKREVYVRLTLHAEPIMLVTDPFNKDNPLKKEIETNHKKLLNISSITIDDFNTLNTVFLLLKAANIRRYDQDPTSLKLCHEMVIHLKRLCEQDLKNLDNQFTRKLHDYLVSQEIALACYDINTPQPSSDSLQPKKVAKKPNKPPIKIECDRTEEITALQKKIEQLKAKIASSEQKPGPVSAPEENTIDTSIKAAQEQIKSLEQAHQILQTNYEQAKTASAQAALKRAEKIAALERERAILQSEQQSLKQAQAEFETQQEKQAIFESTLESLGKTLSSLSPQKELYKAKIQTLENQLAEKLALQKQMLAQLETVQREAENPLQTRSDTEAENSVEALEQKLANAEEFKKTMEARANSIRKRLKNDLVAARRVREAVVNATVLAQPRPPAVLYQHTAPHQHTPPPPIVEPKLTHAHDPLAKERRFPTPG